MPLKNNAEPFIDRELTDEELREVERLSARGAGNETIAVLVFSMSKRQYENKKRRCEKLRCAANKGKAQLLDEVGAKVAEMALEGDGKMATYILNCKSNGDWSEKKEIQHSGTVTLEQVIGSSYNDDGDTEEE